MTTSKLLRYAWRLNQVDRAVRHPGHFAGNRVKSKALTAFGFWKLWRAFWRV